MLVFILPHLNLIRGNEFSPENDYNLVHFDMCIYVFEHVYVCV